MAGYLAERGERFSTPEDYCFSDDLPDECGKDKCLMGSFFRCAHCEIVLCLTHFYADYHYCGGNKPTGPTPNREESVGGRRKEIHALVIHATVFVRLLIVNKVITWNTGF
jgi:hypothetical protein